VAITVCDMASLLGGRSLTGGVTSRRRVIIEPLELRLDFDMVRQPDDSTCGPACLQALYRYFGEALDLQAVIGEVEQVEGGGTLAVHLGRHALGRGYRATLISWDLRVFDPTWFHLEAPRLRERLEAQARAKGDGRLRAATAAYIDFLERGGEIRFEELTGRLIRRWLERGVPMVCGLSATFLYRESRERRDGTPDDLAGDPVGHFVVLTGYDRDSRTVLVADPQHPNELSPQHTYSVPMDRLLGAIFLGVLTYDANLLVVRPPG
jgi:hypothetical protein